MKDELANDYALLSLASEKRKFAIELGCAMEPGMIDAFERGIDKEWFTLVDISTQVAASPGRVLRVFRLTNAGMAYLVELKMKRAFS